MGGDGIILNSCCKLTTKPQLLVGPRRMRVWTHCPNQVFAAETHAHRLPACHDSLLLACQFQYNKPPMWGGRSGGGPLQEPPDFVHTSLPAPAVHVVDVRSRSALSVYCICNVDLAPPPRTPTARHKSTKTHPCHIPQPCTQ